MAARWGGVGPRAWGKRLRDGRNEPTMQAPPRGLMRYLLALSLLVALASAAAAQPVADQFERLERTSNGVTVKYGLFVPDNYDPDVAYPLVMALHGAGERGSDYRNLTVGDAATNGLTNWATPSVQDEHPAFVLAPQVPSGLRWSAETDPDQSGFTPVELTTLEILDSIETDYTIDPDRIYVAGLSMGGHGTWDFISRLEGRFAAAVPMSGEGFTSQADDVLHVPIWAFTGETDTVVPPGETRRVIQAMEDLGREPIYTNCRRSPLGARAYNCGSIGLDSLAEAIRQHADLIYTSEPSVGHGPWGPWFRHPLLADWLFAQVRQDTDALTITAPAADVRWTGTQTVTWTTTRSESDTVEVWLSLDGEFGGTKLGEVPIADGAFSFDTDAFADAALAEVRLFVRNEDGRIADRVESGPFALDNAGNAPPTLRLDAEDLRFDPRLSATSYDLTLTAADAEGDALTASVFYSTDDGQTFSLVADEALTPSVEPQTISLDVEALPNSPTARFRVELSDGDDTASATTAAFLKQTPRESSTSVQQIEGEGEGTVAAYVVDEDAVEQHRYHVTFDASDPFAKTFSVTDVTEGRTVLSGVPFSDGVQESPVFDGVVVVVEDLEEGRANLDETGWTEGDSDLGVTISGGQARISILTLDLLATETDYEITMTDAVAGRSISLYRIPETDLRFTVTGDDGEARDVVFVDENDDGRPGDGDVLYIVEPDAEGDPALAWKLAFDATAATELPETGDVFRLVPVRSLGDDDVFLFEPFLIADPIEDGPEEAVLHLTAYPNPFSETVTVAYRTAEPAAVTVEVFDALGRLVATLADGPAAAGEHRAAWGAGASGVYHVRLTARPASGGPAHVVRQSVVRVGR